jgi:hypothetical protein
MTSRQTEPSQGISYSGLSLPKRVLVVQRAKLQESLRLNYHRPAYLYLYFAWEEAFFAELRDQVVRSKMYAAMSLLQMTARQFKSVREQLLDIIVQSDINLAEPRLRWETQNGDG